MFHTLWESGIYVNNGKREEENVSFFIMPEEVQYFIKVYHIT